MTFPVSVLIAHKPSREEFFQGFCLPSVKLNEPDEILIDTGPGGGAAARNRLAARARSKYVFFANDDEIFRKDAMGTLWAALQGRPDCS